MFTGHTQTQGKIQRRLNRKEIFHQVCSCVYLYPSVQWVELLALPHHKYTVGVRMCHRRVYLQYRKKPAFHLSTRKTVIDQKVSKILDDSIWKFRTENSFFKYFSLKSNKELHMYICLYGFGWGDLEICV